ncbi:MAG TPA: FAD-dependent monooxygenase [Acidobacteriaceae bacterium]
MSAAPATPVPAVGDHDAMVIGAGLAGSSLALWLTQAGRRVLLIEKTAAAHAKVCGEFLSHEALHYLHSLSIDPEALGAVPIEYVRLVSGRFEARCRLPFPALSLSRETLDEALLLHARASGVCIHRGQRVQSVARDGDTWIARLQGGRQLKAPSAFLATGKHDLQGWNRPPGTQNDLIAFKMYWRLADRERAALDRHVELILFPGGYAGLQPVEESRANLCLLVSRAGFSRAGGTWAALLAHMLAQSPHLARRLSGANALWASPLSLFKIPYGLVMGARRRDEDSPAGLWRLGDQSSVIPSFSGEGMSIALHSARLAAAMYGAGADAAGFERQLAQQVGARVQFATLLSRAILAAPASVAAAAWGCPALLGLAGKITRIPTRYLLHQSAGGIYDPARAPGSAASNGCVPTP